MSEIIGLVMMPLTALVCYALARLLFRWQIDLLGHFVESKDGERKYIFALQNSEDVDLHAPLRLAVCVKEDGQKFESEPSLHCGGKRKIVSHALVDDKRTFQVDFDRFPALDTWLVSFHSKARPENIEMRLTLRERRLSLFPLFEGKELAASAEGSLVPLQMRPSWWALALGACALVMWYLVPILCAGAGWLPGASLFPPLRSEDGIIVLVLVACTLLVFVAFRRRSPPIIQGYLSALADNGDGKN